MVNTTIGTHLNDASTTARVFEAHLFRFSQSHGWQKLKTDHHHKNDSPAKIRVMIPNRSYLAMPEIKTRVWLVDQRNPQIVTATIIRRDARVKISSNHAILVLVFGTTHEAVNFCDCIASPVLSEATTTTATSMTTRMDPKIQWAAERERGVDVLSYVATLLTDRQFLEFAQNLENAIMTTTDGRALMDNFLQNLSRPL